MSNVSTAADRDDAVAAYLEFVTFCQRSGVTTVATAHDECLLFAGIEPEPVDGL
jgi:hypothetical protein